MRVLTDDELLAAARAIAVGAAAENAKPAPLIESPADEPPDEDATEEA